MLWIVLVCLAVATTHARPGTWDGTEFDSDLNLRIPVSPSEDGSDTETYSGSEEPTKVIACEGQKMKLYCPDAGKIIKIVSANYGRTQPGNVVCPHSSIQTTQCFSSNTLAKVSVKCGYKAECELEDFNGIFGDPCYLTYKYLELQFKCV